MTTRVRHNFLIDVKARVTTTKTARPPAAFNKCHVSQLATTGWSGQLRSGVALRSGRIKVH